MNKKIYIKHTWNGQLVGMETKIKGKKYIKCEEFCTPTILCAMNRGNSESELQITK